MNILLVTNAFTPRVVGVARSVTAFTDEYRRCGHKVMIIGVGPGAASIRAAFAEAASDRRQKTSLKDDA